MKYFIMLAFTGCIELETTLEIDENREPDGVVWECYRRTSCPEGTLKPGEHFGFSNPCVELGGDPRPEYRERSEAWAEANGCVVRFVDCKPTKQLCVVSRYETTIDWPWE